MKKRNGLTLIEVIVSIALLGMITVIFLSIYNSGNKNIFKSGDKTQEVISIQQQLDDQIKNFDSTGKQKVKVTIQGVIEEKEIKGELMIEEEGGIKITTFVPNKVGDK